MDKIRVCWKCGVSIEDLPFPLSRMAKCPACQADLHVCLLCRFYDTSRANQCQEPIAEPVNNKQRANFCDYFQVLAGAYQPKDTRHSNAARQQLAALFGEDTGSIATQVSSDQATADLNKLFGIDDESVSENASNDDNSGKS